MQGLKAGREDLENSIEKSKKKNSKAAKPSIPSSSSADICSAVAAYIINSPDEAAAASEMFLDVPIDDHPLARCFLLEVLARAASESAKPESQVKVRATLVKGLLASMFPADDAWNADDERAVQGSDGDSLPAEFFAIIASRPLPAMAAVARCRLGALLSTMECESWRMLEEKIGESGQHQV